MYVFRKLLKIYSQKFLEIRRKITIFLQSEIFAKLDPKVSQTKWADIVCAFFCFFFYIVLLFLFFPLKFCLDEFSVITGRILLKFRNMMNRIDMDMKFCKNVSKVKMVD